MKRIITLIIFVMLAYFLETDSQLFCSTFPMGVHEGKADKNYHGSSGLVLEQFDAKDNHGPIDIIHYKIETAVYPLSSTISGKTTITIKSMDEDISSFKLDLEDLQLDSVKLDGIETIYSYDFRYITINPTVPIPRDSEFEVEISYQGKPTQGFYFTRNAIYSNTEPSEWTDQSWSRFWFPCKDVPWDKATSETITRVPENMKVASNGILVDVVPDVENKEVVYHWSSNNPVSTYLICIAISDYYTFSDYFGNLELTYFVYPYMKDAAPIEFSDVPDMISFFSDKIYPYPFEKYGMAVTEISGGMENQTLTFIGPNFVTGYKTFNWLYAHELAHQWFGDMVTLTDWKEIWLNEGFATYFDALYTEYSQGKDSFKARLEGFKGEYFDNLANENFPIYAPGYMWGATVYEKGALVLHMLRNVVGDDIFWAIIQKYAREFAYSNSTIADFIRISEDFYGEDLGWFFDEWIYDKGYPTYNLGWFSKKIDDNRYAVEVVFQQTQMDSMDFPLYKMPFEFEFLKPEEQIPIDQIQPNSFRAETMIDNEFEKFTFLLDFDPIRFNPDSDRVSLRKMYHLPNYVPTRYGTVGMISENVENILLVNGSSGSEEREIAIFAGTPFKLEMIKPSYLNTDVRFVIYAKFDECNNIENIVNLPSGIGSFCFSIPPIGGDPIVVANNIGFEEILGTPLFKSFPAPSAIIDVPTGFENPMTITFQGLILDSTTKTGISVTNAIVVRVVDKH
jgi:hypothetical protein